MHERYIVGQYIPCNSKPVRREAQSALPIPSTGLSQFKLPLVASYVICLGAGLISSSTRADSSNPDDSVSDGSSDIMQTFESEHRLNGKNRMLSHSSDYPSLDGTGNNISAPNAGATNTPYRRIAAPSYSDGLSEPTQGPNARYISNRVFEDHAQNLLSENSVTQWAYNWGQFIDHSIGLRAEGTEPMETPFDSNDPLELFTNSAGVLRSMRSDAALGTGTIEPRELLNVVSSFIDAAAVYRNAGQISESLIEQDSL